MMKSSSNNKNNDKYNLKIYKNLKNKFKHFI